MARNSRRVGALPRGAGSMLAACKMFQTVDAAMVWPSGVSSPWILRCPHRLFSFASCRTSWRIADDITTVPSDMMATYEIDLTPNNAAKLCNQLDDFVQTARRTGGRV
ncbi:hypothetical protein JOF56_009885 [Kibdelosporangium banguiense]|uniref:Lsr2 dimerization domain-containing protein n=1 Tax=Kibdelosporangium banguiense TaxID=1365924 RepID=A0ABS4TYM6_9PSEU|nr:Lsr2 family protein [Kibdelosporangium banguiense]MBP2329500.1 hypothetical protein [Kibdelosporangium banguiense]